MSLLTTLLAASLAWGAVLWIAGRALQRSRHVTGRTRQWIWRGAMILLLAPWAAAPVVMMMGLGLAPPSADAVTTPAAATFLDDAVLVSVTDGMGASDIQSAVIENGGTLLAWLATADGPALILAALMAGWLARFVMAQLALRALLGVMNRSRPAQDGWASEALSRWTDRLGLKRRPQLRSVPASVSPFSCGVVRPTIFLPEGLEDRLGREAVDLVVGHECVHVARGDGWLRPLERIPADLLWFNPFAWAMRRELDVARELACDEQVIDLSRARTAYARALRDVAGFAACLPQSAPAASMSLGGGGEMALRVTRALATPRRRPARAVMAAALALGLIGGPAAVAQVMLATPAPQAPPVPDAPDAPDAPGALEAPPAPAPPAPPAPPAGVYSASDGTARASFAAIVRAVRGGPADGYVVELEDDGSLAGDQACTARIGGLGSVAVGQGERIAEGAVIGRRSAQHALMFDIACTGDGAHAAMPAPPAPPVPPVPTEAVAPAAPPAPVLRLAPAPAPLAP